MGSCALKGYKNPVTAQAVIEVEGNNSLVFDAPVMRDGKWRLGSKFLMSSGDVVEIEAYLTPETIRQAQAYGEGVRSRLGRYLNNRIQLRGDWAQFGLMGRAAATVAKKTAEHPLLNLPVIGTEENKSHPAYSQAKDVLKDYGTFQQLRTMVAKPGCRSDWRELMAGACHFGNCCCGKRQIMATYDGGWLLGSYSAFPQDLIAHHVTDVQALRSYRAIYG